MWFGSVVFCCWSMGKGRLELHVIALHKAAYGREIYLREKKSRYRRGEVPLKYSGAIHEESEWMPSNENPSHRILTQETAHISRI